MMMSIKNSIPKSFFVIMQENNPNYYFPYLMLNKKLSLNKFYQFTFVFNHSTFKRSAAAAYLMAIV